MVFGNHRAKPGKATISTTARIIKRKNGKAIFPMTAAIAADKPETAVLLRHILFRSGGSRRPELDGFSGRPLLIRQVIYFPVAFPL
jgi:hypothetical protein